MNKPKLLIYLISFITILGIGYKVYSYVKNLGAENSRINSELIGTTQKYEQLNAYVAKLQVDYKSQEDLKKLAETQFKDQIDALQGRIKILSDATFLIREKARETNNSDVVFNGDYAQYVLNEIRFNDGPPVGYVLIFKDGRVVSKLYDHSIKVHLAVSRDEDNGRYSILEKAGYVLRSPSLNSNNKTWIGQEFPLPITDGVAYIDPTEPNTQESRMFWWNPKVNLNANADFNRISGGLGASLMSYGATKNDSTFKFLELGLQEYGQDLEPTFIPILWRPFSFFGNTYIGAGVSYDNPGERFFLNLTVGM